MTKEEKQLVIKDLAARLPYGVIVYTTKPEESSASHLVVLTGEMLDKFINDDTFELIPYLRDLKDATKEEKDQFNDMLINSCPFIDLIDWKVKHMFDFRYLLPDELAYPASPSMYTIQTGHKC